MNEALSREENEGSTPVERKLRELLFDPDENGLDPAWTRAQALVSELALRPAKRLRPKLLHAGYLAGGGNAPVPDGFWTFATGLEVLHTFMLIHDDVADQSAIRRGGPALHPSMGQGREGENLAVVAGDHLFARAVELLFTAPLQTAPAAAAYYPKVCRHTAVGQFLDIGLGRRAWSEVTPFDALKVAELKTAQYSVAAPLGCGAMLAGASAASVEMLQRLGRFAGVAFHLEDDLVGLFGDPLATGKPTDCDLRECKKSFPLLLAYRRATSRERRCLERLGAEASPEQNGGGQGHRPPAGWRHRHPACGGPGDGRGPAGTAGGPTAAGADRPPGGAPRRAGRSSHRACPLGAPWGQSQHRPPSRRRSTADGWPAVRASPVSARPV